MANLTFKVLSSPDATVLEAFREIWRRLGEPPGARLSYALADNVGATTVPLDEAEQNPPFAELLAADAAASRSLTVHVPLQGVTATVSVARPNPNEPPGFDTVNWNVQEQVGVETIARLSASVQRAFKPTALPAGPSRILGPELEEYYRRREESLGELERLAGKLIRETSEAHAAIRAELERDRQKLMREVDESEKQRQGQYVEQLSRLEQQRATLAKRESELDDRSRTHARRQLRSDLKSS